MKKNLVVISALLLIAVNAFAWGPKSIFTNGLYNGRFFYSKDVTESAKMAYVSGAIDAFSRLNPQDLASKYPSASKEGIYNYVRDYYRNNPTQIDEPVVDVVISGCR